MDARPKKDNLLDIFANPTLSKSEKIRKVANFSEHSKTPQSRLPETETNAAENEAIQKLCAECSHKMNDSSQ